jgi:hypothetical protein
MVKLWCETAALRFLPRFTCDERISNLMTSGL